MTKDTEQENTVSKRKQTQKSPEPANAAVIQELSKKLPGAPPSLLQYMSTMGEKELDTYTKKMRLLSPE